MSRAEVLDALESVLPFRPVRFPAKIPADDDVETLRHLAKEGKKGVTTFINAWGQTVAMIGTSR